MWWFDETVHEYLEQIYSYFIELSPTENANFILDIIGCISLNYLTDNCKA